MVKLLIQEILVLINNYFSFFEFWSNCGQTMVKSGQTVVKLLIQEILVLINKFFRFLTFGQTMVKSGQIVVKLWSNYLFKKY